jgi:hypothetical protein
MLFSCNSFEKALLSLMSISSLSDRTHRHRHVFFFQQLQEEVEKRPPKASPPRAKRIEALQTLVKMNSHHLGSTSSANAAVKSHDVLDGEKMIIAAALGHLPRAFCHVALLLIQYCMIWDLCERFGMRVIF